MTFIGHHSHVIHIAPVGDVAILDSGFHRAAWLVGVGTIRKTALAHQLAHLWKTLRQGLFLKVIQHKFLDAWRVNNPSAKTKVVHLGKGSRMLTFLMVVRDGTYADIQRRVEGVHKR